ncbi:MAG: hypothetical protein GX248_07185 [Peptococcaceae bacterium]|jgi:hypothetical protein|nr:hypothetical protein [Peptococcaceae bacterium]
MEFSEFSKRIHPNLSGISSQGHFVGALFNAAGSKFFPIQPSYGTDDYQRKVFSGARKLNKKMKDSFPKPIDAENLKVFFQTRIGESSLPLIMSNFGIPLDEVQDKNLFISALCTQFQNIVSEAANQVADIVASEYNRLLCKSGIAIVNLFPFYPGDDLQLISELPIQNHVAVFYEKFDHQWTIRNTGTVTWVDRYFECTNQSKTRIRAMNTRIDVPQTKPGDEVCLAVKFDARGIEGTFESIWEMKDNTGRLCFPDKSKTLKLVATVINRPSIAAEV